MARIIMLGGGVCGLAGGMLLARDGHEVTALERDAAPVPDSLDEAWGTWDREGVTQFRLAHFLAPAGCAVLGQDLPEVLQGLVAAGAARLDLLALMPPNLRAGPEQGCRRGGALGSPAGHGREGAGDASCQRQAARGRGPARLGRD